MFSLLSNLINAATNDVSTLWTRASQQRLLLLGAASMGREVDGIYKLAAWRQCWLWWRIMRAGLRLRAGEEEGGGAAGGGCRLWFPLGWHPMVPPWFCPHGPCAIGSPGPRMPGHHHLEHVDPPGVVGPSGGPDITFYNFFDTVLEKSQTFPKP
jgi:hypothetical protein